MKKSIPFSGLFIFVLFTSASLGICAEENPVQNTKDKLPAIIFEDNYIIGSGDVLNIVTWKEEDFTRSDVLVRIDGKITFPLLNDIQAAGRRPMDLKKHIEAALKDYVSNPVVTVTVKAPVSQKFYILGEVANTGEYPLQKNLTVLQAFALAGGFTEWASKKEIILLRQESGGEKIIRINYKDIVKGKDFSKNMVIRANDTIIVP